MLCSVKFRIYHIPWQSPAQSCPLLSWQNVECRTSSNLYPCPPFHFNILLRLYAEKLYVIRLPFIAKAKGLNGEKLVSRVLAVSYSSQSSEPWKCAIVSIMWLWTCTYAGSKYIWNHGKLLHCNSQLEWHFTRGFGKIWIHNWLNYFHRKPKREAEFCQCPCFTTVCAIPTETLN